jgi:hypothetical protein
MLIQITKNYSILICSDPVLCDYSAGGALDGFCDRTTAPVPKWEVLAGNKAMWVQLCQQLLLDQEKEKKGPLEWGSWGYNAARARCSETASS